MDEPDYTKCNCPNPGWCPRFSRKMHGRLHDICQGKVLSVDKQERYRRHWAKAPQKPRPEQPPPPSGAGTELTTILGGRIGRTLLGEEKCNRCILHAGEMDRNGIEWCADNIPTIVGWLRESAEKRGMPFSDLLAGRLVGYAIRKARKKEKTG